VYPVLAQIGSFQLRSYGVVLAASFLLAAWLAAKEARRKGLGPDVVNDFVVYALIGGIAGARLYYVAFSKPSYFVAHPWEILAVWRGGIGIIGAVFGGFVAALWYCRRRKVPLWRFADALAPALILGQAAGVLACLLNGDSYGKASSAPWAIVYTDPRAMAPLNVPLHPVELYEMAAYLLVFALVWLSRRRWQSDGALFLLYLAGYGAARFAVEFFRGDPAIFAWGIPAAQVFGVALVVAAAVGLRLVPRAPA
jgi:phosphatidylglycerol:prolipoprotein diacylglycerol transferase